MENIEGKRNTIRSLFSTEEFISFIDSFYSGLKKRKWTNEEIQTKLGRRSISEIIASGETCFMGSCVDASLVFLEKLKEKGVDMCSISLGCELLKIKRSGVYSMHFFIKDCSSIPSRVIDFVRAGNISIYDSEYKNPKDGNEVEHLQNFYLNANTISGDDSLLTISRKMNLPVSEKYFDGYIKKLQTDNTDETYNHFVENESGLMIVVNDKIALYKPLMKQEEKIGGALSENFQLDDEHKELYSVMNEFWGIIGGLFGYPYGVVVGMDRALRSETDSSLETRSKQDFLLGTHQDLLDKYGLNDAIEVTYIRLKSGAVIEITNGSRGQTGKRNSLSSLMNYADRILQYDDPDNYKKFYDLWFKLQKFGKKQKPPISQVVEKKNTSIVYDKTGKYHYKYEGD